MKTKNLNERTMTRKIVANSNYLNWKFDHEMALSLIFRWYCLIWSSPFPVYNDHNRFFWKCLFLVRYLNCFYLQVTLHQHVYFCMLSTIFWQMAWQTSKRKHFCHYLKSAKFYPNFWPIDSIFYSRCWPNEILSIIKSNNANLWWTENRYE